MQEVISMLQTPSHTKRSEVVALVSEFLTQGIPGICFAGVFRSNEPGPQNTQETVARTLDGLAAGHEASIDTVVQFLHRSGVPLAFEFFLKDKGLARQEDNKPKGASLGM